MDRLRTRLLALVGISLAASLGRVAWAADAATTTASAKSSPAAAPAADASAPVIRPIVIKFSGEIVNAAGGALTVRDRYGVTKEMLVDGSTAKVTRGAAPTTVADLKSGDQVTVDYVYDVSTGKRNVQTITVAEPSAGTASAPGTATAPAASSTSVPAAKQ